VEPRKSRVSGEGEPAKHREGTKGQVQNEDSFGRKLIEHVVLPDGSAFSGWLRFAAKSLHTLIPWHGNTSRNGNA
jgi:hypothetical protein